jgi:hypothetical protein
MANESNLAKNSPEVFFEYGTTKEDKQSTFAWQFNYDNPVNDHFGYEFSALNQGHFPGHHRDGFGAGPYVGTGFFDDHLFLSMGVAPWVYADTVNAGNQNTAFDHHGVAVTGDVAATWRFDNHVLLQARAADTKAFGSFDVKSYTLGLGYELGDTLSSSTSYAGDSSEDATGTDKKNEIDFLAGRSVVNITGNGHATASSIEYRRSLTPSIDLSVSAIDEGKSELADRRGVAAEAWLKKDFASGLSLGVGAGPYVGIDDRKEARGSSTNKYAVPMFSMTAGYTFGNWGVRTTWDRVFTPQNYNGAGHNADSDIFLAGVFKRF